MKDETENMPFVDRVTVVAEVYNAVCQLHSRCLALKHGSGDIKALWSQTIFIQICIILLHNTGRHDVDFGREGLIYY